MIKYETADIPDDTKRHVATFYVPGLSTLLIMELGMVSGGLPQDVKASSERWWCSLDCDDTDGRMAGRHAQEQILDKTNGSISSGLKAISQN